MLAAEAAMVPPNSPANRSSGPRALAVIAVGDGFALRWHGELKPLAMFESRRHALNAALQLAWREQVDVLVQRAGGGFDRLRPLQPVEPEKRKKSRGTER